MVPGLMRLSDFSVICRVTYLHFPIQACFSSTSVSQPHGGVVCLPNIGRRTSPKIWGVFLNGVYCPENDSELIPIVKMGSQHPVEGSFGSEFPLIYSQCGVL